VFSVSLWLTIAAKTHHGDAEFTKAAQRIYIYRYFALRWSAKQVVGRQVYRYLAPLEPERTTSKALVIVASLSPKNTTRIMELT
jgi:hypothetical protein